MRRTLVLLVALLVVPASAHAASPRAIQVATGIKDGKRTYVMKGQRVLLQGARPFADPGFVTATVTSHGHSVVARGRLHGAAGAIGGVKLHFTARRTGSYRIAIRVFKDSDPTHLVAGKVLAVHAVDPRVKFGQGGLDVRLLQRGLRALSYVTPLGGSYGDATGRAVLAFRKVNGMARTETADHSVFAKLFRGQGGFTLRYPKAGRHVEFDWSRQVLVFAQGGKPVRIYHASSGKPSTPTVLRHLPLLLEDLRHQRQGHGRLELLHPRLRRARLRAGPAVRRQPRLHPRARSGRGVDLRLDPARRDDLRLPVSRR